MIVKSYLLRLCQLMGGLAITSVGVVVMLQANMGLEPWSILQQGMSKTFGITFGTASIIVGTVTILISICFRESFGIGTLANIFCCGPMIDALQALRLIPQMHRPLPGLLMLFLGMELLTLGTWLYMKSCLGAGPRDSLMVVLARKTGHSVGACRIAVELVAVVTGWLLGGQLGIGTVICAAGFGTLLNLNFGALHFYPARLHQETLTETWKQLRSAKS